MFQQIEDIINVNEHDLFGTRITSNTIDCSRGLNLSATCTCDLFTQRKYQRSPNHSSNSWCKHLAMLENPEAPVFNRGGGDAFSGLVAIDEIEDLQTYLIAEGYPWVNGWDVFSHIPNVLNALLIPVINVPWFMAVGKRKKGDTEITVIFKCQERINELLGYGWGVMKSG